VRLSEPGWKPVTFIVHRSLFTVHRSAPFPMVRVGR